MIRNLTESEKRSQFDAWYDSPAKVSYRHVRDAGGGHVPTREESYELYCRRWKPVGAVELSELEH